MKLNNAKQPIKKSQRFCINHYHLSAKSPHWLKVQRVPSLSLGYHRFLHEEDLPNATPVITLELLSRNEDEEHSEIADDNHYPDPDIPRPTLILDTNSGVHFLTEDQANSLFSPKLEPMNMDGDDNIDDLTLSPARSKHELLEYLIRSDGSVVCKLCGEILQSRTHWYRHKYKFHVAPAASPAPLFKCEQCCVFFKSRKGYIGHLASRHPENDTISSEPLGMLTEAMAMEGPSHISIKQEPIDAELAIPRCELTNTNYSGPPVPVNPAMPNIVVNPAGVIRMDAKKTMKTARTGGGEVNIEVGGVEWEKQRRREERLVADIIARVRRECEASGAQGGTRRGYSRRSALTNG